MKEGTRQSLAQEFTAIQSRLEGMYDSVEIIEILEPFIKKILDAYGVKEVVLASHLGPECEWEVYETTGNSWGETIQDAIEMYKNNDPEFDWLEPIWLEDSLYYEDAPIRKIIVRLGFVDGRLKLTNQFLEYDEVAELSGNDTLYSESEWLRMENVPYGDFWIQLTEKLLNEPMIWVYNEKYPEFHRLPR